MSLKNAAFFALVGMVLLTVLLLASFITTASGALHGVVSSLELLTSLIHLFTSLAVMVFFFVFWRAQA